MFRKIVLPIDLTERHQEALKMAVELARASGGELVLLHIIEVIPGLPIEEEKDFYNRLEKRAKHHLAQLAEPLKRQNVPYREEVGFGNRVAGIVHFAEKNGTDLIVLTAPRIDPNQLGTGWGSLSYKVGILARCPVLLVK
jgi:nucleotide-binding universal stress UspA family protein